MRIFVLGANYAPEKTSVASFTTGLCEHLASLGHHVTAITAFPGDAQRKAGAGHPSSLYSREIKNGVELRRVACIVSRGPGKLFRRLACHLFLAFAAFFAALFAGPCDLIYCSCPPRALPFAAYLLGLLKRAPFILKLVHLSSNAAHPTRIVKNKFFLRLPGALERFVYSRALAVVCPCQALIDRLSGCGLPPLRLHLIPDWAGTAESLPACNSSFRESCGIPSNAFLVVHLSSLGRNHDLRHFVCAPELTRDDPELLWLLVAAGEACVSLEQEILRHRLANIRLFPPQSPQALAQMYAAADAFLFDQSFPAAGACVPSTLLACMFSGRPVVAAVGQCSEVARQVRAADCGILVPAENPQALVQAVSSLRWCPARRKRLGRNARLYAEAHLTKTRVLQSYEYLLAFYGFPVTELATGSSPSALVSFS